MQPTRLVAYFVDRELAETDPAMQGLRIVKNVGEFGALALEVTDGKPVAGKLAALRKSSNVVTAKNDYTVSVLQVGTGG